MSRLSALDPVADPHCGRSTWDLIGFSVGGDTWEVEWGSYDVLGTAAFWVDQTVRESYAERVAAMANGTDFETELVYCLLGGFGVTAELAHAACQVVLKMISENPNLTADDIERRLREPLPGGIGRYRFPRQRAQRIAAALGHTREHTPPDAPIALRSYLLGLNGVGPKTAGWIVRNLTGSAEVAIIDIWLIRALTSIGIFKPDWRVERHYGKYEEAFLQYAAHGNVQPGALDLCIWQQARIVGTNYFPLPSSTQ